ncbi:MAG: glycoside hydrolase family 88 protein, partial [Pseudobutyrivibrio sp.]|nr:glycoside hydrolase family 88 protein [Pseudobutyrivibrio sp.]
KKHGKCIHLENVYNGEAAIECYIRYKNPKYLTIIEEYVTYLKQYRTDKEGSLPYFDKGYDILVDGLMICPFIFSYCKRINNDMELRNIGYKQIVNFIKHGLDNYSNLPFHAYNFEDNTLLGISGWGRGVGWFLSSVSISLSYMSLDDMNYELIKTNFERVCKSALKYQNQDGLFYWQIQNQKGIIDTSATSMILYAIGLAINSSVLDESYKEQVRRGCKGIKRYIVDGVVTQAMGDCRGIAMYPQFEYGSWPWSNGFYLLLQTEVSKF